MKGIIREELMAKDNNYHVIEPGECNGVSDVCMFILIIGYVKLFPAICSTTEFSESVSKSMVNFQH